ncbi:MAG: DUF5309 family protein, partial [Aurantimicrobium sp.]
MAIFMGMRSTNDFTLDGQRPKNWRETLLRLYPNANLSLTALTALMKSERVNDPEFNWYTKKFASQSAVISGIYSGDAGATGTTIAGPVTVGTVLSLTMGQEDSKQFKAGHTLILRNKTNVEFDLMARVVKGPVDGGPLGQIVIKMFESSKPGKDVSIANMYSVLIIGSAYGEGALIPNPITRDPVKWNNFTQIFRNSLKITRTAQKTRLRTGPAYEEAKRDTLEDHGVEMEKAFLFGVPSETVDEEGNPLRTTGGLLWAIKQAGTLSNFLTDTTYPMNTKWVDQGQQYMNEVLERIFRYGSSEKMAFAGSGAILALNSLAWAKGQWNFTAETKSFGIDVVKWVTPFGTINLKTHPLFSLEETNRYAIAIFEPKNLRYRYIDDTSFFADPMNHGMQRRDAKMEEFLTEAGMEFHFPEAWGFLNGLGLDKTVENGAIDNGGGGTPIPPPASLGSITLKAGATTTMASRKGSWYDLPVLDVSTSYTVTNATPTNASFQFTGTDGQWHDCVITGGKFTTP